MDTGSGRYVGDAAHLQQSIHCILSTPIGSRVMRREFGSLLPGLIDQPLVGGTVLRVLAASAMALMRWEPRLRISLGGGNAAGQLVIDIEGQLVDGPRRAGLALSVPLAMGGAA
ncbi:GPW/gp25 family protein [Chitiniphilus shinanonensis]|nr:GPW/gp25 family protein [Chitiniphilus shinanonensis]